MASSSTSQKIVFSNDFDIDPDVQLATDEYGDDVLPPESMLIKTFAHTSGSEGLHIEVSDANEKAYFFLTPGEAAQLRRWLNARDF